MLILSIQPMGKFPSHTIALCKTLNKYKSFKNRKFKSAHIATFIPTQYVFTVSKRAFSKYLKTNLPLEWQT